MHPFIKIICLLITIAMLVAASVERVILIAAVLLLFLIVKRNAYWHDIWRMTSRLKWLWLSLLVLYGWFIPGTPLFFSELIPLALIPSQEGLILGLLRASALLLIVSAVVIIISSTQREVLITSIMWLMSPLQYLNINTGLFAARLVLTLEQVAATESDIRETIATHKNEHSLLQRGIESVALYLLRVEQQANESKMTQVSLPQINSPTIMQWMIPLILLVVLYAV